MKLEHDAGSRRAAQLRAAGALLLLMAACTGRTPARSTGRICVRRVHCGCTGDARGDGGECDQSDGFVFRMLSPHSGPSRTDVEVEAIVRGCVA